MKSRIRGLVGALALAAAGAGCSPPTSSDATGDEKNPDDVLSTVRNYIDTSGNLPGPANQQVTQTNGKTWDFTSDDVTLLYFGYTSCPDVCPTTMADLAVALRALPDDVADELTVRFVTTDPHRDTLRQLRSWLQGFDPGFIGARAPIGRVVKAAQQYSIGIVPPKKSNGNYKVTHGAQMLVLRPDGRSVGYFREGTRPESYVKALPHVLEEAT